MGIDPASPRYARQRSLAGFGTDGQARLAGGRVLVIGAGGLGSTVLPILAAAGVGSLTVVDDDTVDVSNLHRQTLHSESDAGRGKAESAVDRLRTLAPDAMLRPVRSRFDSDAAAGLLSDVDVLVDATDNPATRYLANDAAASRGIPLVWGSALAYGGQAGVAWSRRGVDYRDLFPYDHDAASTDSCDIVGVLPSVCGVIGAMMASEVMKLLTGIGEPLLGRVATYDALTGRTREVTYRRAHAAFPGSEPVRVAASSSAAADATSAPTISAEELAAELVGPNPPLLIDVREAWEAEVSAIPGSVLIPLDRLAERLGDLDREARLVVYCQRGTRSERAMALLAQHGFANARHLARGIAGWTADTGASGEAVRA